MSERVGRVDAAHVLLWVYAVFVLAAGSRSLVQLASHPSRAPWAYALSVVAAIVYAVGFVLVRRASPRVAGLWAVAELVVVLVVGTLTIVDRAAFPDATVWSDYGAGYLGIPLLLPVAVLLWARTRYRSAPSSTCSADHPPAASVAATFAPSNGSS